MTKIKAPARSRSHFPSCFSAVPVLSLPLTSGKTFVEVGCVDFLRMGRVKDCRPFTTPLILLSASIFAHFRVSCKEKFNYRRSPREICLARVLPVLCLGRFAPCLYVALLPTANDSVYLALLCESERLLLSLCITPTAPNEHSPDLSRRSRHTHIILEFSRDSKSSLKGADEQNGKTL